MKPRSCGEEWKEPLDLLLVERAGNLAIEPYNVSLDVFDVQTISDIAK